MKKPRAAKDTERPTYCPEQSKHRTPCGKLAGHPGQHECHYGPGCCWPRAMKPASHRRKR